MIVMSYWSDENSRDKVWSRDQVGCTIFEGLYADVVVTEGWSDHEKVNEKIWRKSYSWSVEDRDKIDEANKGRIAKGKELTFEAACAAADNVLLQLGAKLMDSRLQLMQ